MTLYRWRHWFWITGFAPVLLVVLLFLSTPRCWAAQVPVWSGGGFPVWPPQGDIWAHPVAVIHPHPRRLLGFSLPSLAPVTLNPSLSVHSNPTVVTEPVMAETNPSLPVELIKTSTDAESKYFSETPTLPDEPQVGDKNSSADVTSDSGVVSHSNGAIPTPAPEATDDEVARKQLGISSYEMANDEPARSEEEPLVTSVKTPDAENTSLPVVTPATLLTPSGLSNTTPPSAKTSSQTSSSSTSTLSPAVTSTVILPLTTVLETVSTTESVSPTMQIVHPALGVNATERSTNETAGELSSNAQIKVEGTESAAAVATYSGTKHHHPPGGGLDAGSITGIVLGTVVLAGLLGTISFVLYRRRYLNKPQTLNDKCSNPDSSGYLDETTLRENSEEMYSLDNDSFLNSLEAMTITNYWTDSVKHTKL